MIQLPSPLNGYPKTPVPPPEVLAKQPRPRTRCRIKIAWIIDAISRRLQVDTDSVVSHSKTPKVQHARRLAMYLAWKLTDLGLTGIGAALGGHDARSVTRSVSRTRAEERSDKATAELLVALEAQLAAPRYSNR